LNRLAFDPKSIAAERPLRGSADDLPCCSSEDVAMTVDQRAAAITQSMSRKANCWDNAPMESFFDTLKTELVHQCEYPDRGAARRELFACIGGYYNRQRIHCAVGYITPEQADRKTA
jgi:transposase InsO family protein